MHLNPLGSAEASACVGRHVMPCLPPERDVHLVGRPARLMVTNPTFGFRSTRGRQLPHFACRTHPPPCQCIDYPQTRSEFQVATFQRRSPGHFQNYKSAGHMLSPCPWLPLQRIPFGVPLRPPRHRQRTTPGFPRKMPNASLGTSPSPASQTN